MKAKEFWIRLASSNRSDWVSRFELSNDAGDIYHVIEKSEADKLASALSAVIKYATEDGCSCAKGQSTIGANKLCVICVAKQALAEYRGKNE